MTIAWVTWCSATNYSNDGRGVVDVNADGRKDYVVYKCMFGCSGDPRAFTGKSTPCPWGSLLLSEPEGYEQVFLPGKVNRFHTGLTVKISIKRPRALRLVGNFCKDPFPDYDPEYAYQLKEGRFQLLGMCSPNNAQDFAIASIPAALPETTSLSINALPVWLRQAGKDFHRETGHGCAGSHKCSPTSAPRL